MMWTEDLSPRQFQAKADISAETLDLYQRWYHLLTRWNQKINLVGQNTLSNFWLRHALDSHQLYADLPAGTKTIIDLGAGAGFPGIALAILMRDTPGAQITMVESNGKKCNFLRTVIRELSLPATAVQGRAENLAPQPYDVVTARAFAPLPKLLTYAQPFWHADTLGIFPKGESWEAELNDAKADWDFTYEARPSQTDELARVLKITGLQLKTTNDPGGDTIDHESA
jgi:16S rRNA (guanine527-N7)-methyltransferase